MRKEITTEEITIKLEKDVFLRLEYFAKNLDIPLSLVIQNLLIDQWARDCARFVTGNRANPSEAPEFSFRELKDGSKQLITGYELFNYLEEIYKKEYVKKSN